MAKIEEKKVNDKVTGLGEFKEATGGGEPIPKGQKMTNQRRVMQPRDENGQFTYNAANKHPLKTKVSRGKTIPPYLNLKKEEEDPKDHKYIHQMDKYDFKAGKSKEVHTDEKGKENIYNVETTFDNYNRQSFATDLRVYVGEQLYKEYYIGNIMHFKKKDGVEIDPTSKEGFNYKTKIGETSYEAKKGKKSLAENASLAGDYKGDINQLSFAGDKIQKEEVVNMISDYKSTGKKKPNIMDYFKKTPNGTPKAAKVTPKKSGSSTISSKPFDANMVSMAKNNYSRFSQVHHDQITALSKLALSVGAKLSPEKIAIAVASGKYNSFNDIANMVKKYAKNKKSK